jgi:hypothetical protein
MNTTIPPTTKSTVMNTAIPMGVSTITNIIMRVNTITSIVMATATMLNHIITGINTQNITGITSMNTPATKRSFVATRYNQLIARLEGVTLSGYAPIVSLGHDSELSSIVNGWLRREKTGHIVCKAAEPAESQR